MHEKPIFFYGSMVLLALAASWFCFACSSEADGSSEPGSQDASQDASIIEDAAEHEDAVAASDAPGSSDAQDVSEGADASDARLRPDDARPPPDDLARDSGDGSVPPAVIVVSPSGGSEDVPRDQVITVRVVNHEDAGEICEFERDSFHLELRGPEGVVPGRLYFYNTAQFPAAKRVDFRSDSFLEPLTTYELSVSAHCASAVQAAFTTEAASTEPLVRIGDSMRIDIHSIDHPESLGGLLGSLINNNNILVQVTGLDLSEGAGDIEFFGGEGRLWEGGPTWFFRHRIENFSMVLNGTMAWPHFKVVGTLTADVGRGATLTLEHFELGGTMEGEPGSIGVPDGYLIGITSCTLLCETLGDAIEEEGFDCGALSPMVCDDLDALKLLGSFTGAANDLGSVQTISVSPQDGAQNVPPDVQVEASFTHPVDPGEPDHLYFVVSGEAGEVPGETVVAQDGLAATFTPLAPLVPGTYTVQVVTLCAIRTTFSCAE